MASEKKMVCLRSSDGAVFEVSEEVISAASVTIKVMIDDEASKPAAGAGAVTATTTATPTLPIPIPNVTAATLSRVLNYVNKHSADIVQPDDGYRFVAPGDEHPLARFDEGLVDVDNDALVDLVHAAEYLNIKKLFDLACEAVAEKLKGRTIDEIRKTFGIANDYTEEEEEEVRRENSRAFQ